MRYPRPKTLEMAALYNGGASLAEVAAAHGLSRQNVWERIRKYITARPQRRYGAENHFHRGGSRADGIAHNLVEAALRAGILVPRPCEVCGSDGVMADGRRDVLAHHDDYTKPLAVRWLCQRHHFEWHCHNRAIGS